MFSELAKDHNITLTIAGNGPELENIRKIINPEIADKVTFTGHVTGNEKVHAYKNADIYLFPSQYEGMPTSVLEAMGFGLPIICSSVGALPDFFENGKMGFILNKDDKDGFRIAIESLIKNKQLRESIGTYNHTYATKHFLASITVNRIDEDYKSLIWVIVTGVTLNFSGIMCIKSNHLHFIRSYPKSNRGKVLALGV